MTYLFSDITRYYMQELGKSEVEIGLEIGWVGKIIDSEIQDLRWAKDEKKANKSNK